MCTASNLNPYRGKTCNYKLAKGKLQSLCEEKLFYISYILSYIF